MTPDRSPSEILHHVQLNRPLIQDFCPLAESIEWQLGQQYFRERGNKAFIHDATPVPFVVNNNGLLSSNAAELFYAGVEAADRAGTLEDRIFVLELGIGVGLFARFFLDRFRDLCAQSSKDYYERLCYVAADRSESMLLDAVRHGLFGQHAGRYRLRVVDALDPRSGLAGDGSLVEHSERPFRAVFLNYLLDCLPAAILQVNPGDLRQLCIRTYLARGVELGDFTDIGLEGVARRACSVDPEDKRDLIPLYGLFASDHAYLPLDPDSLPDATFAVEFARSHEVRHILHSYGAVQSIERLSTLLRDDGFLLVNDYGHASLEDGHEHYEHNRFSGSTAIGLNFSLLKACVQSKGISDWIEPSEEPESVHPRLVGRGLPVALKGRFEDLFNQAAFAKVHEPSARARTLVGDGRFELAASAYREALGRQPWNWALMSEAARFLSFRLRDPAAGLALSRAALVLNPSCSADLWNDLGDSLFLLNRIDEARTAFARALRVNPGDVRARFNLACVHVTRNNELAALLTIAEGLALDESGHYRQGFLKQQADVLERLDHRWQRDRHLQVNRVSEAQGRRADGGSS